MQSSSWKRWITTTFALLVCYCCSLACGQIHSDEYEPCPAYPFPIGEGSRAATAREVLKDDGVISAIRAVDQMLQSVVANKENHVPGLIATIVLGQETAFTKGYGSKDPFAVPGSPNARAPEGQDLVRIASITKVFTDLLMFQMRDDGSLPSIDEDASTYLPDFQIKQFPGAPPSGTTLRELASHTSGLPRELPYPCAAFEGQTCSSAQVFEALSTKYKVSPPYHRFHYSNLGMAVLGRALGSALSGVNDTLAYEKAIRDRLLLPLGMLNATFAYNETTKARAAVGSTVDGKPVGEVDGKTCGFGAPAGCLWASANDLARLMKMFFTAGASHGLPGLQQSTLSEMMKPAILLRDGSSAVGSPMEMKYLNRSGFWSKGKQGELPGFRSSVTMVGPLNLGIFISALVSDVPELSVWTIPALDILAPAVAAAAFKTQPKAALPPNVNRYLGTYFDNVSVAVQDNALMFKLQNTFLNLTLMVGDQENSNSVHVFQAHPFNSTAGCRWLDDGVDTELVYFQMPKSGTSEGLQASSITFMGSRFDRTK